MSLGSLWKTTRFDIDLSRPRVMGIVNVTPDSFSDGGRDVALALRHCEALLKEGADLLDIGGESTRPGADPVSVEEELLRVLPVVREAAKLGVPVSVDTRRTGVMRAVLDLGADVINDVQALADDGAEALVVAHGRCGVCLMHMQGTPLTMQQAPRYSDVVDEVADFLADRAARLVRQGVEPGRIALDPGIGFGKRVEDNFALIQGQRRLLVLGHPVLAGWSRKSSLGAVTGRAVGERLAASVAAALAAVHCGARIVRVHDVAATVDALAIWSHAGLLGADEPTKV